MLSQSIKQVVHSVVLALVLVSFGACSNLPNVAKLPSFGGDREESTGSARSSEKAARAQQPQVKQTNQEAFNRALAALEAQRWQEAEPLLRKITADQPGLAGPWVNLAQVYMATDQMDEARMALSQAVEANPGHCAALNQLGVLSRQVGDFAAAEQHYKRCLSTEPDNQIVVLNLGILYELYLGRLPEALAAYRQYQDLNDSDDRKVKGWVMDLERRLGV